jgi:1,4-alpha-glucan branching enzyme
VIGSWPVWCDLAPEKPIELGERLTNRLQKERRIGNMLKKTFSKDGKTCRVTFTVPAAVGAQEVFLCGEFNDWSETSHPLKRRKDGRFSSTLSLEAGRSYRFRYLLDGERWENDEAADAYTSNPFGGDDSIIQV